MKPFEAHNIAEFALQRGAETTNLTWVMERPLSYAAKIIHLSFDMDRMVGKDFESGLANLKALAEN